MENVVSIFTGQTPCDKLILDHSEFMTDLRSNNGWVEHLDVCQDCLKRYLIQNRETLADVFYDIHDD